MLMGAQAVGREILVVGRTVDRERPALVIEADHVLRLDRVCVAGLDPHPVSSLVWRSGGLQVAPPRERP